VSEPVLGVSLRALAGVLVDFIGFTLNEAETIVAATVAEWKRRDRRNP
jgi:hypothetical protein